MVKDFAHDLPDGLPEGTEGHEALRAFAEAAGHVHFRIWETFHDTPAGTLADRLLKVRVHVEADEPGALAGIRGTARDGLAEIVRMASFPPAPAVPPAGGTPVTHDGERAFLTARPDQIPHTSPADLLRLFTPEEGAEVFAIMAGYLAARKDDPDKLPQARATLRAYGEHATIGWELICRQRPYPAGMVLSDEERTDLARLGHLPEAAIGRLAEWTRRTEAELEEERQRGAAEDRAKRNAQMRERHGPPLRELLQQVLPDFTCEACAAAASLITAAEILATCRTDLTEDARKLTILEMQVLRRLDITALPKHLTAGVQETVRQELALLIGHEEGGPDA